VEVLHHDAHEHVEHEEADDEEEGDEVEQHPGVVVPHGLEERRRGEEERRGGEERRGRERKFKLIFNSYSQCCSFKIAPKKGGRWRHWERSGGTGREVEALGERWRH